MVVVVRDLVYLHYLVEPHETCYDLVIHYLPMTMDGTVPALPCGQW